MRTKKSSTPLRRADRSELAKVTWLDLEQVGPGRVLHMMPVFENGQWTSWLELDDGRMFAMNPLDVRGLYLSREPAHAHDLYVDFLDLLWQRASFPHVADLAASIGDDVENLATSVAKIDFFASHADSLGHGAGGFVTTEIEYLLVLSRSILDLLHDVAHGFWATVQLTDEGEQRKKLGAPLPEGLAKTCLHGDVVRTAAELTSKHALPSSIATAYEAIGTFLLRVRGLRDAVVHRGRSTGTIFNTPRGFAIERQGTLARIAPELWTEAHEYNEVLVSLRPLVASIALSTLEACSILVRAFASTIRFMPPVAPRHRVHLRSDHGKALHDASAVLRGGDCWWHPGPPDDPATPARIKELA